MKRQGFIFEWMFILLASLSVVWAQDQPSEPTVTFDITPKQEVYYVGQRVTATVAIDFGESELYGNIGIDGLPDGNAVQYGEFRQINSGNPQKIMFSSSMVLLKKGTIVFGPVLSGDRAVRTQSTGFIRRQINPFRSRSNLVEVTINVPPSEGRPDNYCGAVGVFKLSAELTPNTCAVGDLLNLKWSLIGNGLADDVTKIEYKPGQNFKVYPPRVTTQADGVVSCSQVIISTSTNVTQAAAFKLSVFNPIKGTYETLSSRPFPLTVVERVVQTESTQSLPKLVTKPESARDEVVAELATKGTDYAMFFRRRHGEMKTMSMETSARLSPDAISKTLFEIPAGAIIEVRETSGDWSRVLYNGSTGWVPGAILSK